MDAFSPRRILALAACATAACAIGACSDDDDPRRPGSLDGNVIVWDGPVGALDAGAPDDRDAGRPSDADPPMDASTPFDADVPLDAGARDGSGPSDGDAKVDAGPCSETPVARVTAEEAQSDPGLLNAIVEVRGRLAPGPIECSAETCSEDAPCCQACAAVLTLDDTLELTGSACREAMVGCGGSNCATTCSPPVLGGTIRVVGRLVAGDDAPVLQVWDVVR